MCTFFLQDYGDEVRGCHTREDIQDEEVIIEVPLKCLITVEMGKETEVSFSPCSVAVPSSAH